MEEVTESEETAVQRPGGTGERSRGARDHITLTPAQNNALSDGFLPRVRLGVEVLDSRLGDIIQETEASKKAY